MELSTVPGQPGHLAEVLAVCFPETFGAPSAEPHCFATFPGCPCAHCTPPAENSNPSGASEGADGQGACIPKRSNLDNTRRRSVVKGCKVRFPGGAVGTVARVRLGQFWTTTGTVKPRPTDFVSVVA